MGKSSRKNKNDRINKIRKQYDAFLEEDKKRRERNEYILGKLDKMRSSAALVPVSNAIYNLEMKPSEGYIRRNNQVKKSTIHDNYIPYSERPTLPLDIINKHIDESIILKEISKKYILIPKRLSILENDYICRKDAVNDQDWKSKYNILDVLKSEEKVAQSDNIHHKNDKFTRPSKDSDAVNSDQSIISNLQSESDKPDKINEQLQDEKGNEVNKNIGFGPETKDINVNNIPFQTSKIVSGVCKVDRRAEAIPHIDNNNYANSPSYIQSYQEHVTEKEKHNSDFNEKNEYYLQENIKDQLQVNESNIIQPSGNQENMQSNKNSMAKTCANKVQENNVSVDNFVREAPNVTSQQIVITDSAAPKENFNQDEVLQYKKEIPEIQNLTPNVQNESYDTIAKSTNNVIEPNQQAFNETSCLEIAQEVVSVVTTATNERTETYDMNNSPEGKNIQPNESTYNTTPGYETTQNNDSVLKENTEQSEYENQNSEINAFEAEQKEMFYSEQTGEDTYAYNQGDGNAEYSADGFQQNDQYAYYEGVQQEQAYATNINEHEEATEQYDPHYNQQYEGSYDHQQSEQTVNYENTETYEQHQYQDGNYENPQYDNVVNYENQHENAEFYQHDIVNNELQEKFIQGNEIYERQLYGEPETQEHIEEQLVAEEGYVVNSQMNVDEIKGESIDESEPIMNNTTPSATASIPDTKVA